MSYPPTLKIFTFPSHCRYLFRRTRTIFSRRNGEKCASLLSILYAFKNGIIRWRAQSGYAKTSWTNNWRCTWDWWILFIHALFKREKLGISSSISNSPKYPARRWFFLFGTRVDFHKQRRQPSRPFHHSKAFKIYFKNSYVEFSILILIINK